MTKLYLKQRNQCLHLVKRKLDLPWLNFVTSHPWNCIARVTLHNEASLKKPRKRSSKSSKWPRPRPYWNPLTPTPLENITKNFPLSLCSTPPILAGLGLSLVAPSALNFNTMEGGKLQETTHFSFTKPHNMEASQLYRISIKLKLPTPTWQSLGWS